MSVRSSRDLWEGVLWATSHSSMKEHAKPIATLQLNDSANVIITEHSVIAVYIKLLRGKLQVAPEHDCICIDFKSLPTI